MPLHPDRRERPRRAPGGHTARALAALLTLGAPLGGVGCAKDGDDGYTALLRYNVTDFRVAGIDAKLGEGAVLPFGPGTEIELEAVILQAGGELPEIEWLDCETVFYGEPSARVDVALGEVVANPDCLGTPREIRLGRGARITYKIREAVPVPWEDGEGPVTPQRPPAPDGEEPEPVPAEEPVAMAMDDGVVFLRATAGDTVRYGRKVFLGLLDPQRLPLAIDAFTVDDEPRPLDTRAPLVRAPGQRLEIRFTVSGVLENRAVQWFVTGGELARHGLTYYVEVGSRGGGPAPVPTATAQNSWILPDAKGDHELVAVVGGGFAELPHVRLRVEVRQ